MDQQTESVSASATRDEHRSGISSGLMIALEQLSIHHGLPYSHAVALNGVAMNEARMSYSDFERACSNLGLASKIVKKRPSQVPGLVCPFVVFLKSGDVGLVLSRSTGSKKVSLQIAGETSARAIDVAKLDAETHDRVIYVAPALWQSSFNKSDDLSDARSRHWLWGTVRRFWGSWAQVVLAAFLINLLGLALPIFVMNVYDRVIPYNAIPTLWALAGGVALALVFDFLLRMLRSLTIDKSGRRIDMKVSSDIYRHAIDATMKDRPPRAGDIASQIREFETVRDFFTSASLTSVIDLVFVGLFLFVLWLIVGPLALVPLIAVPIVLGVTALIQIPLGRSVSKGLASSTNRHSVLVESLVGIETVKAIAAEGAFQQKWERAVAESVRATSSSRFWSSLAIFFSMLVQQGVSVVIIVWGVFLVAAGEISVGALIASNILAGRVLAPLGGIAMTLSRLQQSMIAYRSLNKLMALDRDHAPRKDREAPRANAINQGRLEVRNASFSYPNSDHKTLDGLNLTIAPGERVGIVGRVGSGKSTFGKLLCGLYETTDGAILLDNTDIRHNHLADLRQAVSYLGQEPHLFSGSVRDNILFSGTADDDRFEEAVHISGVASMVQTHPLGYQMPVGERGAQISGGQRQAIAIARSLMGDPKILFLDEPTSAMDSTTEAAVVQNLARLKRPDMTLLIATHRSSLLELVDRVIVIESGRVVADGPRKNVLSQLAKTAKTARAVKRKPEVKSDGQ
ncbi:MAG: type I secretion system permease/ATPase [Pseudomonadota bacterium]